MGHARRFDHVNITVKDLESAVRFFETLGLVPDSEPQLIEGHFLEGCCGIDGARTRIVMMRLPGADTTVELASFVFPECTQEPTYVDATALGLRSIAFEVDDVDAAVERVGRDGYGLVKEIVQYEDVYRLCYVKGPEGVIVMLAQRLNG